jgi:hypothetical protein
MLSQTTAIALYDTLARRGAPAFDDTLQRYEANLDFT